MSHYLWLYVGIFHNLGQLAPDLQPSRVYAGSSACPPVARALSWRKGHPLLAATSTGRQSWWHRAVSPPLPGRGELGLGCCHWEDSCSWWWSTCHRDAVSPKALVELKHDCKHTTLSSTRVNPTACLAGRFAHPWWMWGRTMGSEGLWPYPNPPVTGKTELNKFFFSGEWRLTESPLLFSWLFTLKSVTVKVSPLYAVKLIKTWFLKILLRKTQINFVFTTTLWKERKRKGEREKQPDFWFWT